MSAQTFDDRRGSKLNSLDEEKSSSAIHLVSKEMLQPGEKSTGRLFKAGAKMSPGDAQLRVVQ
jgi:hypothetical protein